MKVAIIGYGKMGRLIKQLCELKGFEIVSIIDNNISKYNKEISVESLNGADVAIEFTQPKGIIKRIEALCKTGVNIVIGTSGWYDKIDEVILLSKKYNNGIIYSANFSIGMNVFFQTMEFISKVMNKIPDYDVYALEEHHNTKKDKPSGTAKYITNILSKNIDNLREDFTFEAIRAGKKPGTHMVGFDGDNDFIEFKHQARDRSAFVSGAILSADWIMNKKGFYNFSNNFKEIFGI